MKAFDSIKMGHRCKEWSLAQSEEQQLPNRVLLRGTSVDGQQWIVNASGARVEVLEQSKVVLDGGPRWVLSTSLGFVTGGVWWTCFYAALFALANYAMYTISADAPEEPDDALEGFDAEVAGIVAYTILAAAISLASVPGPWRRSDLTGLASGLVVEVFLCWCVIVSAGIIHRFFGPSLAEHPGLSPWADAGRWSIPALVWTAAAEYREMATQAVKMTLSGLWCSHPMGDSAERLNQVIIDSHWNEWASAVQTCAVRVGGYGMLGFSASELKHLSRSSPTTSAVAQIELLLSSLSDDGSTAEPWVKQSLAFLAGYDSRLRIGEPKNIGVAVPLYDIKMVINSLSDNIIPSEVQEYRRLIDRSCHREKYAARTDGGDDHWFFAGAFMADSDSKSRSDPGAASELVHGSYGCRFAVSVSLLVKGTDPVARLACYTGRKMPNSSPRVLSKALRQSARALVSDLAFKARVNVDWEVLGTRGLAFVDCTDGVKSLSYSPDELAAASHLHEVITISDETFAPSLGAADRFENLWGGSGGVEKKVDISDMVPKTAGAGGSAFLGWICHLGFTLAMLTIYMTDNCSEAVMILCLVAIPARNDIVSAHLERHFFMIYIRYILNYARFVSRWASLAQRGQATLDKAKKCLGVVFFFVNILPVAACYVFTGWKWWVAFLPCLLANLPGLFNSLRFDLWRSAFQYEWWSWHVPNRWFLGRGYLEVAGLRNRVGRNVLVVNAESRAMRVEFVKPVRGLVRSGGRFVVVGGGSWRTGECDPSV